VDEGVKVLKLEKFGHEFEFDEGLIGAIDETGSALPDKETLKKKQNRLMQFCLVQLVILGMMTLHLKVRPEQNSKSEKAKLLPIWAIQLFDSLFKFFANKTRIYSRRRHFLFFRELTGGLYFSEPKGRRDNRGKRY